MAYTDEYTERLQRKHDAAVVKIGELTYDITALNYKLEQADAEVRRLLQQINELKTATMWG